MGNDSWRKKKTLFCKGSFLNGKSLEKLVSKRPAVLSVDSEDRGLKMWGITLLGRDLKKWPCGKTLRPPNVLLSGLENVYFLVRKSNYPLNIKFFWRGIFPRFIFFTSLMCVIWYYHTLMPATRHTVIN